MEALTLLTQRRGMIALGALLTLAYASVASNAYAFDFGCIDLPTGGQFCFDDSSSSSSSSVPASSSSSSAPASSSSTVSSSSSSSTNTSSSSSVSSSSSTTSSTSSTSSSSTGGSGGGGSGGGIPTCYGKTATIYVDSSSVIIGGPSNGQLYAGVLTGTDSDDVIVGTHGADEISAKDGNDIVCALGGNDIIDGGDDNDTIFGGDGDDEIDGRSDNDILCGEAGNDIIEGGFGDDILCGGEGDDDLEGNTGSDKLDGGPGHDILDGRTGNDICINGEDNSSCETTTGTVECPASSGAGTTPSSSSSSSVSSTSSSSSSSTNGSGGSGGGGGGTPANVSTVSSGSTGGGGGGGGSRTRPIAAALNFIQNYYQNGITRPTGILGFAAGGYGGNSDISLNVGPLSGRDVPRGTPFSGMEKRLTCNLIKTVDRTAGSETERTKLLTDPWTATLLSQMLGRDVSDIRRIFRDADFCDDFQGSIMREEARADTQEVAVEDHGPMTFAIANDGAPYLEGDDMFTTVWNNCVRNRVTRRSDGRIYNCSRYQVESTLWGGRKWIHPQLGIQFGWNYKTHRIVFASEDYQNGEGIIVVQREASVAYDSPLLDQ